MPRIKEINNQIKILDIKMKFEDETYLVADYNKKLRFEDEDIEEAFLEATRAYIEEITKLLIGN